MTAPDKKEADRLRYIHNRERIKAMRNARYAADKLTGRVPQKREVRNPGQSEIRLVTQPIVCTPMLIAASPKDIDPTMPLMRAFWAVANSLHGATDPARLGAVQEFVNRMAALPKVTLPK